MNALIDRLSIAAAVLTACAAVANVCPVVRIVPVADGVEIGIELRVGKTLPAAFARLLEAFPATHCTDSDEELDT